MNKLAKACFGNKGTRLRDPGSVYVLGGKVKSGQKGVFGTYCEDLQFLVKGYGPFPLDIALLKVSGGEGETSRVI